MQPTELQELVISSQGYKFNKPSSVLQVVVKHVTQVMPGQTVWINVEATQQDDRSLTSNTMTVGIITRVDEVISVSAPEQSKEFIPVHHCLLWNLDPAP